MPRQQTAGVSLRLVVEIDGDGGAHFAAVAPVKALAPPSLPLESVEPGTCSGILFEVQDSSGRTLYRRATEDPRRTSTEVRTDDRDRLLARAAIGPRPELGVYV